MVRKLAVALFDLDGVIRMWPSERWVRELELSYGLELGTFDEIALSEDLVRRVTTGLMSKAEWRKTVRERIPISEAVDAWFNRPVFVNWATVDVVRFMRARDIRTYLLSNGTDELPKELDHLALSVEFDGVFNSFVLGCRKPDAEIFHLILATLNVRPGECAFVDDTNANVEMAHSMGFQSCKFVDVEQLNEWMRMRL